MRNWRTFLLCALLCIVNLLDLNAQVPVYEWTGIFSGVSSDEGKGVGVDTAGNIYSVGYFRQSTDFDPGAGTFHLQGNSHTQLYVHKMNPEAEFEWVVDVGGYFNDFYHCMNVDASGNVYLVGGFNNTVDFDPGPGIANLTSDTNEPDLFVLKLNTEGEFQWVRSIKGPEEEVVSSISVNESSVHLIGWYRDSVDFDPGTNSAVYLSENSKSSFVLKLNAEDGSIDWVNNYNSSGNIGVEGKSIALDDMGNMYCSGTFSDTLVLNSDSGVLVNDNQADGFVLKLSPEGEFLWAKQIRAESHSFEIFLDVDAEGNSYCAGHFYSSVDFDPSEEEEIIVPEASDDCYLLKLDVN